METSESTRSMFAFLASVARWRLLLLAAVSAMCMAVLDVPAPVASAAPQPAPVSKRWQLDFRPGPLRIATIEVPDVGLRTFFYLTYEVVNNSGRDLQFAPSFELASDDGALIRSGRNVPNTVTKELLRRLKNQFVQDEVRILGLLQQGEEYAREGLVIWPADNLKVDTIRVFCIGFSGETRRVVKPDTGKVVTLRKTMMLVHTSPGDISIMGDRPIRRTKSRWILR